MKIHFNTRGQAPEDENNRMPAELMRRYEVVIAPRRKQRVLKLREVSAAHVGKLVSVKVRARAGPHSTLVVK